jgi:hypothetical protein
MSHTDDLNALMSRVNKSGDKDSIKFVRKLIAAVKEGDKDAVKGIVHFNRDQANLVPASVTKWLKEEAMGEGFGGMQLGTITLKFHFDGNEKLATLRTFVKRFGAKVEVTKRRSGGSGYTEGLVVRPPDRAMSTQQDFDSLKPIKQQLIDAIRQAGATYEDPEGLWTRGIMANSYEAEGDDIQEDEWGGGFQSYQDAHKEVQAGLRADMVNERNKMLAMIVKVIRGEITERQFKKLTGRDYKKVMDPTYRNWYINQIKKMPKSKLAPVAPAAPTATESVDMEIQEKVEIDGRTRAYRDTVMRLEQARKIREGRSRAMQENRFGGLYDDGSGKGAMIPAPVDFNFHEAMKVVEKYRSLREKKKTLFGAPKGKMEDLDAAVAMKDGKFSMQETKLSPKQKEYRQFFAKALKKFGHESPADMDDGEKKKFFNWVEKNWKG